MILLLSTSDTDLLAAQSSRANYRCANPSRVRVAELPALLRDVKLVVVRLLGGRATWPQGLASVLGSGVPTVVLGGESSPDAQLMATSTVPAGIAQEALSYLVEGGPQNLGQLAAFLSDTVLRTGEGFLAPVPMPEVGVRSGASLPAPDGRPRVGVIYYRAHELSGNTAFIDDLVAGLEAAGAQPVPVFCASLRGLDRRDHPVLQLLDGCDALIVTVLAAGGVVPAEASAGGDEGAWSIGALAELDIPIMQGICLTTSRADWALANSMTPMDAAMQVAIPEFDGRIITGAVLVQGAGRGRVTPLRGRPRTGAAARRYRAAPGPAAPRPVGGEADRDHPVLLPDQARPGR